MCLRNGEELLPESLIVESIFKGDIDALVEEYYNKYGILLEGRDASGFFK